MSDRLLEIRNLKVTFGGLDALSGFDFDVDEGEIVSVIGPNGAGKTTFFNLISGLVAPTEGEILFEGDSIVGLDPSIVTSLGIARTFQNVRLFPNMTILENVMVDQHCRTSRLEIARAMATQPRLLLLDEPVAGMNPMETAELTALIGRLRTEWGFTIIMIEHDMKVVRDVSDRVVVLDHGVPIAQGSYDEVSTNPDVVEAYLGRPVEAKR